MKKFIFLFSAIAFVTLSAQSQASFGFKAGMTSSNMTASGGGISISFTNKIGFYAGAFTDIQVSPTFSVQPELTYALLGAKTTITGANDKLDLGYLNIPVLAKYNFNGLSLFAGPQLGILLSAKDQDGTSEKDEFNSTDFSGIVGAGYTLFNGFGFDARYQFGLSNIAKDQPGATIKSNAFYIGLHYNFSR